MGGQIGHTNSEGSITRRILVADASRKRGVIRSGGGGRSRTADAADMSRVL